MSAEALLARAFMTSQPARAAATFEQMPVARAIAVLHAVPATAAATVLREMTVPFAAECLAQMSPIEAADIVAEFNLDDAVGIVRAMDSAHREPLLAALPPTLRGSIEQVLPFLEGTAGAVMDPSVFRLADDVIVADARVRIGRAARDLLYYIYVVDRAHHLVGVLDIPELMLARGRDPVSASMFRDVESINVFTPVAVLRELDGWQRYHAMPVVDDNGKFLGAIRYQTLRRLERHAPDRGPDTARVTAGALAELFKLGTTGLVAGITSTAESNSDLDRAVGSADEVPSDK